MEPTLLPGDQVFVVKQGAEAEVKRGDVIVYRVPEESATEGETEKTYLHRVIARGETQVGFQDRNAIVGGAAYAQRPCDANGGDDVLPVPERADPEGPLCFVETMPEGKSYRVRYLPDLDGNRRSREPTALGPQQLFVLGDNRDNSMDSRFLGPIDEDAVVGRAVVVWFSFSWTEGIRWNRMGRRL